MALPPKVRRGEPVKASDWNALIDYLRSSQLQPSAGVRVIRTGMGTTLAVTVDATTRPPVAVHPFKLFDATDSDGPKIRVLYGALAQRAPDGMSDGDNPPYTLDISSDVKIYGGVSFETVDGERRVTSRWIEDSEDYKDNTEDTAYILIGSVSVDSDTGKIKSIAQALTWSPDVKACRNWFSDPPTWTYTWY